MRTLATNILLGLRKRADRCGDSINVRHSEISRIRHLQERRECSVEAGMLCSLQTHSFNTQPECPNPCGRPGSPVQGRQPLGHGVNNSLLYPKELGPR